MSIVIKRISQAPGAMRHFIKDRISTPAITDPREVPKGEGALVKADGKKLAVFKDDEGELHALSPVCTHMQCIVDWNAAEKTWDCPCHGSRYDPYGKVIEGPAKEDLKQAQLE